MATSAERMRALRERARRGIRRLTVDVSDGDLQAMVEHGYAGAASTEPRSAGASHQPFYHRHARQIGQLTAYDGCNAVSAAPTAVVASGGASDLQAPPVNDCESMAGSWSL